MGEKRREVYLSSICFALERLKKERERGGGGGGLH
jgi:hypothetical protein